MNKDIVQSSIECLASMPIEDTTYQVARSVVLDEIERLNNIINELEKELNQEYLIWQCNNRSYGKTIKYGINIAREHYFKRLQELKENKQ